MPKITYELWMNLDLTLDLLMECAEDGRGRDHAYTLGAIKLLRSALKYGPVQFGLMELRDIITSLRYADVKKKMVFRDNQVKVTIRSRAPRDSYRS